MVRICPKCGSTDIDTDKSTYISDIGLLPQRYVCLNCDYTSEFFPEVATKDIEKFRRRIVKKE